MIDNRNQFFRYLLWIIFILFVFGSFLGRNGAILFLFLAILAVLFLKIKHLDLFEKLNPKYKRVININNNFEFMGNFKHKLLLIILIIFGAWLFFASIQIVDAGETGVYSLFGRVRDQELHSGFHLVIPVAKVTRMSIRTEEYTMSIQTGEGKRHGADAITALTKEGLNVDLDITVLYHLDEPKASDVYRDVGLDYEEKIIRPAIRTSIRDIIAQYEAKDIYSEKRQEAAREIYDALKVVLEGRGIVLEDVLLRNLKLPPKLTQAIQAKLEAEQEAQKYDFILDKEKKEKLRKIIEAEGQRDAQKIINESLTSNYLYYLYIKELKDRQGTIYVPTNPSTGMPLFRDLGR